MKRHRTIEVNVEPFVDWERKRYTGSKKNLTPADLAELETDRDLGKPIEQLLCDVYEGYSNWLAMKKAPSTPEQMRRPVELILYSMARTASMNAVVARESAKLQRSVRRLTRWLWVFTAILILLGAVQVCIQWNTSAGTPSFAWLAVNPDRDMQSDSRHPVVETGAEAASDHRLGQMP